MTWRRGLLACAALIALVAAVVLSRTQQSEIDPGKEVHNRTAFVLMQTVDEKLNITYVYVSRGPDPRDYSSFRLFYGLIDRMEPVEIEYVLPMRCYGWEIKTKTSLLRSGAERHNPLPSWGKRFAFELDSSQVEVKEYERVVKLHPHVDLQAVRVLPVKICEEG